MRKKIAAGFAAILLVVGILVADRELRPEGRLCDEQFVHDLMAALKAQGARGVTVTCK